MGFITVTRKAGIKSSLIQQQWKRIQYRNIFTSSSYFDQCTNSFVKNKYINASCGSYSERQHRDSMMVMSPSISQPSSYISIRWFQNEGTFHSIADETLETIQDELDALFEDNLPSASEDYPELNYASGVLTINLPPHGAWVLNKQTPNRQIWWSSPISGPRRYEWDAEEEVWVNTKYADAVLRFGGLNEDDRKAFEGDVTLGDIVKKEIKQCYSLTIDLDI